MLPQAILPPASILCMNFVSELHSRQITMTVGLHRRCHADYDVYVRSRAYSPFVGYEYNGCEGLGVR